MNKRGGFLDAMEMVLMIPTIILVAFGIGVVAYGVLNDPLDMRDFNEFYMDTYTSQLLNTPNCFAYEDPESKRVDYGVLDKEKINAARLTRCMSYGEQRGQQLPVKVQLLIKDQEPEVYTTSTWSEMTRARTVGREVTIRSTEQEPVRALILVTYTNPRMHHP